MGTPKLKATQYEGMTGLWVKAFQKGLGYVLGLPKTCLLANHLPTKCKGRIIGFVVGTAPSESEHVVPPLRGKLVGVDLFFVDP